MSFLQNYEELSIIGKGAYGTVFKAIDRNNDRTVALKRVRIISNGEEKGVPVSTLREITLLKQLDNIAHPNIVRMFDAFQTYPTSSTDPSSDMILTIVFEHVDQDLSQFLRSCPQPGLPEELIKDLMRQLLSGIDYLHINRMVHRDIKPQNVLITKNRQVKIADFGLARVYGFCKLVTSVVVTLWYRAPEVLLQAPYATKVDLWSAGAIMGEMYNRRPLFPGKNEVDQLQKILTVIGSPEKSEWPEDVSLLWESFNKHTGICFSHLIPEMCPEGLDLIKKLLMFDPNKRISAKDCLSHLYLSDLECPDSQDSGVFMSMQHTKNENFKQQNKPYGSTNNFSSVLRQRVPCSSYHLDDDSFGGPEQRKKDWLSSTVEPAHTNLKDSYQSFSSPSAKQPDYELNQSDLNTVQPVAGSDGRFIDKVYKHESSCLHTMHSDVKLEAELDRYDPGLCELFPNSNQRSFSRTDSGICVSPQAVCSDHESSNSSNSYEAKELDRY